MEPEQMVRDLSNGTLASADVRISSTVLDGSFGGLCNRRLACLKEYQGRTPNEEVRAHLIVITACVGDS